MTVTQFIGLAINASMFMIVLALGLEATLAHVTYLFRQPGLLLRSILAMNIVMLVFAVAICFFFQPPAPIKIALVALALSPVPPVLPGKELKAGGSRSYTIGLLVAAALVSIVLVPLAIELLGREAGIEMHMPVSKLTSVVLLSVVVPLVLGVVIRRFMPAFAARIAHPVSIVATVLLVAAFLPVLFVVIPAVWHFVGSGVLVCLAAFTLVGLAVGHMLGGPNPDDRTVLGLASGTRHPGIAIAVASINFPEQKGVMAVVVFHLIMGAIVSLPYVRWRKSAHAASPGKR
jgi:BASS family bile acid:Na+ symporter